MFFPSCLEAVGCLFFSVNSSWRQTFLGTLFLGAIISERLSVIDIVCDFEIRETNDLLRAIL